jgi:hypothetical protein
MTASRQVARIAGPALLALAPTEAINLGAFAGNTAPVVYLNGTLLFVAGVAILQAYGRWRPTWELLVTLTGWVLALGGLYRMCAPAAPQADSGAAADVMFVVLFAVGAVLTVQGYRRRSAGTPGPGA